jgi:hypothetical protein
VDEPTSKQGELQAQAGKTWWNILLAIQHVSQIVRLARALCHCSKLFKDNFAAVAALRQFHREATVVHLSARAAAYYFGTSTFERALSLTLFA